VYDTTFIKDTPLVAYFRLKVNDNTSSSEVARVSVRGGGTEYGPLSLRGTDFSAPNQYQEFALNFTFNTNPDDLFLIFQFWRSGSADVYVDAVSIFSAPQAITSPLAWSVPGNNYRGQGVWVRYTNGSQFSVISEAVTVQEPSPRTVSGNTGVGGATLSYNDGTPKTITADGSGNYSITVPFGWSGTVTPHKAGYVFYPPSQSYTDLNINQSAQNYLAVEILTAPGLTLPAEGGHVLELRPTFDWGDVINAGYYSIQISRNSAFTQIVVSDTPSSSALTLRKDLSPDAAHYWRVRTEGLGGPSLWSPIRTFTTPNPPGVPALISPNPGAITMDYKPTLKWDQVIVPRLTEFDHYQIQIAANMAFTSPVVDSNVLGSPNTPTLYSLANNLLPNTKYYWRVRAFNKSNEMSSWSEVRSFSTPRPLLNNRRPTIYSLDAALPAPVIVGPSSDSVIGGPRPILEWGDVPGATSYIVQVSSDPMFTASPYIVSATIVDSRYAFIKDAPARTTLYWRVLTISGGSISEWSPVSVFSVP
jgi:hypothetical protein